jgi:hypothetical protein
MSNQKKKVNPQKPSRPVAQRRNVTVKSSAPRASRRSERSMSAVPAAQTRLMRTPVAAMSSSGKGGDARIRIRQREYVADLSGSVAFSTQQFSINPGLSSTFPWLSSIASRYESYLFRSLRFEYETSVSTATAGTVILAVDYDSADAAPTSKQQIMAYRGAVRSAPWAPCENGSDGSDLSKFGVQRYIRSGSVASTDIKTYDVGNLFCGFQGMAGVSSVGELYVSYDVELMTPELNQVQFFGTITSGGAVSNAAVFGTAAVITGNGDVSAASGNTLTFSRVGSYVVAQSLVGSVFTDTAATTNTSTATIGALSGGHNTAQTTSVLTLTVNVTAIGQTLVTVWTGNSTTVTAGATYVFRTA